MSEQKLEQKVATGVAWSFTEKLLSMVIQMAVSIIVARALMPADFGVMAILTFFSSVALTIVDSGFSQTLIRKREVTDGEYSAVLRFNVITSLLLYILLTALARPIASLYGVEAIADVAPVLFLVLPINSLCVVQTVMYTREFRFALLSKIVFFASLLSGVVAVVMALMGCGIWSLVAQRLLLMGFKAVAFWYLRRWRASERATLASLRAMAPFSLRLLCTDLIASIYNNVAQLFIGKMYSTSALGYYSQAQKLKDLPVTSSVQAIQGVTYPALSAMADDSVKLREGYLRIVRMLAFVLFPAMLGLVAIADDMFMLLLGPKWMPTVPYFEILSLSGLVYPIAAVSYNILKTKSDGRVIVWLEVVKRVVMTALLAYTIPRGVESVAWGMTAMATVEFLLNTGTAMRYVGITWRSISGALLPSLLLAAVMFGALYLLSPYLVGMGLLLRLIVAIVVAIVIYIGLAVLFRLRALREGVDILKGLCRSPKSV